jgi:hypothetical protein
MADPKDRSRDVWNDAWRDLGDDVHGSQIHFGGGKGGADHQTVHGSGWHRSWDVDDDGNVSEDHTTIHWDDGNEVIDD